MMDDAIKIRLRFTRTVTDCRLGRATRLKALSAILQHRDTDHNPPLNHLFGNSGNILVHQVITQDGERAENNEAAELKPYLVYRSTGLGTCL